MGFFSVPMVGLLCEVLDELVYIHKRDSCTHVISVAGDWPVGNANTDMQECVHGRL